jgi:hypothetical protein
MSCSQLQGNVALFQWVIYCTQELVVEIFIEIHFLGSTNDVI